MSNFTCDKCGMTNIDCGKDGYKTPKEIELERRLNQIKETVDSELALMEKTYLKLRKEGDLTTYKRVRLDEKIKVLKWLKEKINDDNLVLFQGHWVEL